MVHCGAGISTSCGVPDFRGPNGIWTMEKKGIKQEDNNQSSSFKDTKPSITHRLMDLMLFKNQF